MKYTSLLLLLSVSVSGFAQKEAIPIYKDPSAPIEKRVDDLMGRMTLEEKVYQLCMTKLEKYKDSGREFGVCESPFISTEDIAKQSYETKKYAREQTRLGIPPIQIGECLHGQLAYGATIFPQAIAQGATWNPGLIKEMASAVAAEASTSGVDQALSPLFDIIRDPRYGRCEECYAEDPFLIAQIGKAFVEGMQGDPETTLRYIPTGKLMCTAKHFAGYSAPIAGINLAPSEIGEREMRSLHLYPFEKIVKEANIYSVMPSYNEVDGIPAHANRFLLQDILRNEWQFKGFVFADYGSVGMLKSFHKVAPTAKEAAKRALTAGVDIEAPWAETYPTLIEMAKSNEIDIDLINRACRRVLTAKFKAGLFEKPYPDYKQIRKKVHTQEHIDLARRIAEESVILLKNDNNLLPLNTSKIKSLAVIGPNADQVQYGDYSCTRDNKSGVTVLQGIKNLVGNKVRINYAKGCTIAGTSKDDFSEAIAMANKSDAVVVVLGGSSAILSGVGWGKGPGEFESDEVFTCGEGYDVSDINPMGVQREFIQAIAETGKPVILVLIHGRPWSIHWEKEHIPAILEAWYPGEQGGNAIADILFGNVNPSGRLNVSIPQSVGHVPVYYNHKPSGKGIYNSPGSPEKPGRNYVFASTKPLFDFGYGLSYTTFEYSDMHLSSDTMGINDKLQVSVKVKNTGTRQGKEVVQLYINDAVSSVTTPIRVLRGFQKIDLQPGETKEVKFQLLPDDLGLWNESMQFVTEPGEFEIIVAKSAEDTGLKKILTYK